MEQKWVVGYLRVSTEAQVDRYGLDAQKRDIMAYCNEHNMYISKWYVEQGVSGVKDDRPEFNKILYGDIENPPYEAVVVAKNDRVARDVNVYYYFKMMLRKKDIELISVAEDFGEYGAMAKILETFSVCFAELERENIKNRTSAGRKVKAKAGGFAGGRVPYGYRAVDGKLVVDEEAADCVRKVFALRRSGKKLQVIADMLNDGGKITQGGKSFTPSTIQNIIRNERIYKGQLKYGSEYYTGVHERIL